MPIEVRDGGVDKTVQAVWAREGGVDKEIQEVIVHDSGTDKTVFTAAPPIDLDEFSFDKSFDVSSEDSTPFGVGFNDDGTKMYMLGVSSGKIYQYTLTTPYDIGSVSLDKSLDVSGRDAAPSGITFNDDGTKVFISGVINGRFDQYALTTAYDIGTASWSKDFLVSSPRGIVFNNDGTTLFSVTSSGSVYPWNYSAPYDIGPSNFSSLGDTLDVSAQETAPEGIAFNDDGTKVFIVGTSSTSVHQYSLTVAFDVTTSSLDKDFSTTSEESNPSGIVFNDDGTKMFISGANGGKIYQYTQ